MLTRLTRTGGGSPRPDSDMWKPMLAIASAGWVALGLAVGICELVTWAYGVRRGPSPGTVGAVAAACLCAALIWVAAVRLVRDWRVLRGSVEPTVALVANVQREPSWLAPWLAPGAAALAYVLGFFLWH